jgi:dipeptidyl aminopeptidase/acylaminoacyl peptidase
VARPFDPQKGVLSGSAVPLVNNLRDDVGVWRSIFAVSQNRLMIYQLGTADASKSHLVLFDRSGKTIADYDPQEAVTANARSLLGVRDVRLSPDNTRVAYASGTDLWTLDLERKTKTRITFDPLVIQEPAWSPDSKTLIFSAQLTDGGGNVEIRSKDADGSGSEKQVFPETNNYHSPGWSPDGKYVTYLWGDGEKMVSLWIRAVNEDGKPLAVVRPPSPQSNLTSYRISHDGHWVAYVSDESGQQEVYITSFPEGRGKWRVSANSGAYPTWSGDGKELFFKNLTDDILVCAVTPKGSQIEVGTPQKLFHAASPGIGVAFDVTSDGKRVLVNHSEEEAQRPAVGYELAGAAEQMTPHRSLRDCPNRSGLLCLLVVVRDFLLPLDCLWITGAPSFSHRRRVAAYPL